jgi:hypothetical protein
MPPPAFGPTPAGTATLAAAGSAGLSSSESGTNPLAPIYNALALNQILGSPTHAGSGSNTSSPNLGSSAAPPNGTSSTPDPTSSASLPSVRNALDDPATGARFPLLVGNVSQPPLAIQDPSTSLPPVQASDQVGQSAATDVQAVTSVDSPISVPIPEPAPVVLLACASAVYLGRKAFLRCVRHSS